jgi:hypothetical protein
MGDKNYRSANLFIDNESNIYKQFSHLIQPPFKKDEMLFYINYFLCNYQ